jgi:hypothetical protein
VQRIFKIWFLDQSATAPTEAGTELPLLVLQASGPNLYKLLENGDAALLYPGGVREAYHGKVRYHWPTHVLGVLAYVGSSATTASLKGPADI